MDLSNYVHKDVKNSFDDKLSTAPYRISYGTVPAKKVTTSTLLYSNK